jgi:hypothetical protein
MDREQTAAQQRTAVLTADVTALQRAVQTAATAQRLATAGVSTAAILTLREATLHQLQLIETVPHATLQRTKEGLLVFLPGNGQLQLLDCACIRVLNHVLY